MSGNLNDIGGVFRNSLKDLKMESNEQLWDRLDQRLSSQPVITPKKAFLHPSHISWVSVAAAASLITFVSLAAYYFTSKRNEVTIAKNKQIINQPNIINNSKDNTLIINNPDTANNITPANRNKNDEITKLTPRNINHIDNNISPVLNKQNQRPENISNKENKKPDNNNNTNTPPQYTNNTNIGFPQNNYNQSPLTQQNNLNNNKTVKNNTTTNNNQQKVIQPNNNKVVVPKDTSRYINSTQNNAVDNTNVAVTNPEPVIKEIKIPNIFTPNGDGVNDYFVIVNIEACSSSQLTVKDRNGKLVYEKNNYRNDWDGHGLPDGVYFYTFVYHKADAGGVKQGSVTILR